MSKNFAAFRRTQKGMKTEKFYINFLCDAIEKDIWLLGFFKIIMW